LGDRLVDNSLQQSSPKYKRQQSASDLELVNQKENILLEKIDVSFVNNPENKNKKINN